MQATFDGLYETTSVPSFMRSGLDQVRGEHPGQLRRRIIFRLRRWTVECGWPGAPVRCAFKINISKGAPHIIRRHDDFCIETYLGDLGGPHYGRCRPCGLGSRWIFLERWVRASPSWFCPHRGCSEWSGCGLLLLGKTLAIARVFCLSVQLTCSSSAYRPMLLLYMASSSAF